MWTILSSPTKNVEREMEREKMKKRKEKKDLLSVNRRLLSCVVSRRKISSFWGENRDGSKRLPKKEKEKLETNQKKTKRDTYV